MGEQQQFGVDTTFTKVFVGGLAWETQREALREHFHRFGDIIEAVIITDKLSGRSKGYGFVTFKEAEAAKKACEDSAPMIDGRKANCNLASLWARRASPSPYPGAGGCAGAASPAAARSPATPVPWYFPAGTPPPQQTTSAFHSHYPGVVPFYSAAYGYSPSYVAPANMSYNTKPGQFGAGGGAYLPYQFSHAGHQGGMVAPGSFMPMYHPQCQFIYLHHNHRPSHRTAGFSNTAAYFSPAPAAAASKLPEVPPVIGATHARPAIAKAF